MDVSWVALLRVRTTVDGYDVVDLAELCVERVNQVVTRRSDGS
jgi:hypothetical protein